MGLTPALRMVGDFCSDDDSVLVQDAQTESEAFGQLYDRYLIRVYGYLRKHTESDEDAADLTQQVFLQALNGLQGYDERKASFATWLFKIARNVSTDAYRRRHESVSWENLPETPRQTAGDDPEAATIRRESLILLRALLSDLSLDKRELLWLRFGADLGLQEIATVVGKTPAAVHKQLTRTLRTLKEGYHE